MLSDRCIQKETSHLTRHTPESNQRNPFSKVSSAYYEFARQYIVSDMANQRPESELQCSICHEDYTNPKILPCTHLICRDCLVTWIKSSSESRCPLCRRSISEYSDTQGTDAERVADSLPTDLAMISVLKIKQQLSRNETCISCQKEISEFVCMNCPDTFCENCANFYNHVTMFRNHNVKKMSSITAEELSTSNQLPICSVHSENFCDLFCEDHNKAICSICMSMEHKKCDKITEMKNKMRSSRGMLGTLIVKMDEVEKSLQQIIKEWKDQVDSIEKKTQSVLENIQVFCDGLHKIVNDFFQTCTRTVQQFALEHKNKAEVEKAKLIERQGLAASHHRLLKRVHQTVPYDDISIMTKVLQDQVKKMKLDTVLSSNFMPLTELSMTFDAHILDDLKKTLRKMEKPRIQPIYLQIEKKELRFHKNCGRNVIITPDGKTANFIESASNDNVLYSCFPLERKTVHEVQISHLQNDRCWCRVALGVCLSNTDSITLPADAQSSVIISSQGCYVNQECTDHTPHPELDFYLPSAPIGMYLDTEGFLHVIVDNKEVTVSTTKVAQPCYSVFDIKTFNFIQRNRRGRRDLQVTSLPVRSVGEDITTGQKI